MGDTKLVFKISPNGELTVEGEGFKGGNCLKEATKYMQALGVVKEQKLKSEYYQGEGQHITLTN